MHIYSLSSLNGKYGLWIVLVLGIFLRLPYLSESFWLDEAAQAIESSRPFLEQFDIVNDFQPPLYHVIVHLFSYVSTDESWLRLSSLIPGILTIYLTIKIGEMAHSANVGRLAGLLLATSPFHIFYSQELRPYSLAAFLGILSTYYLLKGLRGGNKYFKYYSVSVAMGLLSTYVFWTVPLTHLLFVVWKYKHMSKSFLKYLTISIIPFVLWLPTFYMQLLAGLSLKRYAS